MTIKKISSSVPAPTLTASTTACFGFPASLMQISFSHFLTCHWKSNVIVFFCKIMFFFENVQISLFSTIPKLKFLKINFRIFPSSDSKLKFWRIWHNRHTLGSFLVSKEGHFGNFCKQIVGQFPIQHLNTISGNTAGYAAEYLMYRALELEIFKRCPVVLHLCQVVSKTLPKLVSGLLFWKTLRKFLSGTLTNVWSTLDNFCKKSLTVSSECVLQHKSYDYHKMFIT